MYCLSVEIETDDDFTYQDCEFGEKIGQTNYYFNERKEAIEAMVRSYRSMVDTIKVPENLKYIERRLKQFMPYLETICKKLPTFCIEIGFGNQTICYNVSKVKKEQYKNGSFSFKHDFIDDSSYISPTWYHLYIGSGWQEEYNWEELIGFADIE